MGNPDQRGIVAGQLWDPATPYIMTQKMRQNFKHATLLTSRSVSHGMRSSRINGDWDPVCQGHINRYFQKGYVDFVDGHVCEVSYQHAMNILLRILLFLPDPY